MPRRKVGVFRKAWLAANVKAALGGNMDSVKKIVGWIVKLQIVPSGYLTVGAGATGILVAIMCMLGVQVPGVDCPTDPTVLLTAGAGLIGLGRRK